MSDRPDTRPSPVTLPDLSDRRVVLTGGSDGMGVHIAHLLAGAGADLVLPVRNRGKGETTAAAIRAAHPDARVTVVDLDLSSLASVRRCADALVSDGRAVHHLVNNAGVMTPPSQQRTADGFELQLGTNHLGHVALTSHLLPLLRAGGGRVTWQTSIAARRGRMPWDDVNSERSYDAMAAYRASKLACALYGFELDRRSRAAGWGITSNVSHPGVAPTSLLAARPELGRSNDTVGVRVIRWLSARGILAGTAESAGQPALLAATDPDGGGRFYGPSGPGSLGGAPGRQRLWAPLRDEAAAARLWDLSHELIGVTVP